MEIARLVLGLISSLFAGVLCAAIAHSGSHAAKVVAGIMVVLFIPAHYLSLGSFRFEGIICSFYSRSLRRYYWERHCRSASRKADEGFALKEL